MSRPELEVDSRFLAALDEQLKNSLPAAETCHKRLRDAMAHALLGGGKRLRPQLLNAAMQLGEYREELALRAGTAIEMIHAYSLVHDDLPSMDDDDLRHGRPSCHKVYGEAMAILAGDALQALAFETMTSAVADAKLSAPAALAALAEFANTAGPLELVGGQAGDLEPPLELDEESQVSWIHARKTAALIRCCLSLGARLGKLPEEECERLSRAGHLLGLAFQGIDDVLDLEASSEELGKTAGKDQALGKRTLPSVIGVEASRRRAEAQLTEALELLPSRKESGTLVALARRLVHRRY
jgi:geranylgeranyl pyrophosphate synthase